jgi:cellulose synthase/poly-beta-1,6-N-acetylglucosamine synthase-like glycosyltransferase
MVATEILFWTLLFFIFYSYLIYPLLLWVISRFKKAVRPEAVDLQNLPSITLLVAAYNEQDFVDAKVQNSLALNYPKNKLKLLWVSDGSTDKTNHFLSKYPDVSVLFEPARMGKIHAMNRAMKYVNSDIVVFSDGNTLLAGETLMELAKAFQDSKVGCIAGEKRIVSAHREDAAAAGEGIYWKYESWVKQLDSKIGSCVGAAGELFAIRTPLFFEVPGDTILDDFVISLSIAMQGYKIAYTPQAFAIEKASANIHEEMKRKVRIAAGSFQVLFRLTGLLNIFKVGTLSWQYISHKVFRWTVIPFSLLLLIPINIALFFYSSVIIYQIAAMLQLLFYLLVLIGHVLRNRKLSFPFVFVPYYFFMANVAMWRGFFRFMANQQPVQWERAKRA